MQIKDELQGMPLPRIYKRNGADCFLDPYREKLISVTPEEYVRQRVAIWLEKKLSVPNRVIIVEQHLAHYGLQNRDRADIVIHRDTGEEMFPIAVVECKAENVFISDATVQQVIRYADAMGCDYIFLTNGIEMQCYKYDETQKQYFELGDMPTYSDMLSGKANYMPFISPPVRPTLEQIYDSAIQQRYIDEWVIGSATEKRIIPYIVNLFECFMDTTHHLPKEKISGFTLVKDYGVRMMSYGNASGYNYFAPYRSFLICDNKGNHQFVSLGFNAYGNDKTILCVAIDDYKKSHHALQLLVDAYMNVQNHAITFWHNGRIAVGHQGSGKTSELKNLISQKYPQILQNEKIMLGNVPANKMLYLDDTGMTDFVYNLINYALLRDEYRSIIKK